MKKFKIGLQLYSVRDHMEKDMDATLKAVKEMGYDCVEFAGYFDKSAEEIKALLDKYDLKCYSVHHNAQNFLENTKDAIGYMKAVGAKYYAIPWYGIENYTDNWEKTVETFKEMSKLAKENGIELLYHNHEFEFTKVNGKYIIDRIYEEVKEINPQFDTCWVRYADENPCDYLRKYKDRINVVHLKDFTAEKLAGGPVYELIGKVDSAKGRQDNGFRFRPIGSGMQNFEEILKTCEEIDADILIVEQDQWYEEDSLSEARKSREYLKKEFNL